MINEKNDDMVSTTQIYFPNDLRIHLCESNVMVIGYEMSNIYIVFDCLLNDKVAHDFKLDDPELKVIGYINQHLPTSYPHSTHKTLQMWFDKKTNELNINCRSTIIYFDPPNFRNLEYFSIQPILLQSMEANNSNKETKNNNTFNHSAKENKLKFYEPLNNKILMLNGMPQKFISDSDVLDKINQLFRIRLKFRNPATAGVGTRMLQFFQHCLYVILVPIVQILQQLLIMAIDIINQPIIFNTSLVKISRVFRQADLRLQQLNYFPIQFLCYYNKRILYDKSDSLVITKLKIPVLNNDLNINNSNYINFYNSIWLILNDILLGHSIYNLIQTHQNQIFHFFNSTILQKYLFQDLTSLITWISTKHPAGFKLNTNLGTFLGDLYIWTIHFWKLVMDLMSFPGSNSHLNLNSNLSLNYNTTLVMLAIKYICFTGGCSFLIAFLTDIVYLITFHIYASYYCAAKLYKKQIGAIKSLFQLIRGKKYNVLRNRIDNLNNYEDALQSDSGTGTGTGTRTGSGAGYRSGDGSQLRVGTFTGFELDQLLVGTLLFMILIFLLPTVFAFYLLFSILHILTLMTHNLLENLQIVLNFTPLFVIMLKLKNSKRLQGGITFSLIRCNKGVTELRMSNKSLTYHEVFTNFFRLFKRAKNFRDSILKNMINGNVILIRYDYNLKFLYLMLPEEYRETTSVWKYVK